MAEKNVVEEVLEFIWFERERGVDSLKELLNIEEVVEAGAGIDTIEEMKEHDLIVVHGDSVHLTGKGEKQAELVIRRHRLAELLLSEVLEVAEGQLEKNACSFEHSLSPVVTDNICTLLGHPPNCPHGFPIPKGECCKKTRLTIKPLVVPLTELEIGEKGRIIFIVPKSHARLDKLGSLGLVPGSTIRIHQKRPAYVIEIGETTLGLDPEIVKEIYVKKAS
jgi:DtxR family Mn-dependent transcriptional regulator